MDKKNLRKPIDYDRLMLRLFVLVIAAVFVFAATYTIAWFFDVDFSSGELWLGALMVFTIVALIYTVPLYWKIVMVVLSIILATLFLTQVLGLSLFHSLIGGLAVIILILMAILSL